MTLFFLEKGQFFRRKCAKIAESCDHNIDRSGIVNFYNATYVLVRFENKTIILPKNPGPETLICKTGS
jgi:hypothetical protein